MNLINKIHFRNWRGDLFGGLTAAIVALPLALAFGVASGAGAIAGLYGAIIVGFFAALFGGTPAQVSGPTGPMTVVVTTVIATLLQRYPDTGLAMAFSVVMLGGLLQILFGVMRLGQYITLIPYTVISGFMSGIGVIIILLQLPPLLGHAGAGGVVTTLQQLPTYLSSPNWVAVGLGLLTLVIVVEDAIAHHRHVWVVAIPGQVQNRLENLNLQRFCSNGQTLGESSKTLLPQICQVKQRFQALQSALALIQPEIST